MTERTCKKCGETKPREKFEDNAFSNEPYLVCTSCDETSVKENEEMLAHFDTPEGQAEFGREQEEKEAKRRKYLEENYTLYEWTCPCCGDRKIRHIKKTAKNQSPDLFCGCALSYRHGVNC